MRETGVARGAGAFGQYVTQLGSSVTTKLRDNVMDLPFVHRGRMVEPLEVRVYGDTALRRRADEIREVTPEIRELAERMIATVYEEETRGIGLAAPQVGVGLRLIVLATHELPDGLPPNASPGERALCPLMPLALVNPAGVSRSDALAAATEGCLSVPEVFGDVVRPALVTLRATTLDGDLILSECGGLLARCIQHEIDHLDGVLFVDRLTPDEARDAVPELKGLEKRALRALKKRRKRGRDQSVLCRG